MDAKREIMSVAIVCGGEMTDFSWLNTELRNARYIIAADSGYDFCHKAGVVPNIVIGDFDSVNMTFQEDIEKISLPVKKDKTDFEACLEFCFEKGFNDISVYGASGGRPGHSFAAVFAAHKYFKRGLDIKLISESHEMFFVDNCIELFKNKPYVSIFALDKPAKITLVGFQYPLDNFLLKNCSPLGVSNEIVSQKGRIEVIEGDVLVITEK